MKKPFETLLRPLSPVKTDTLRRLCAVTGDFQAVLLGAFARDMIFYHLHGITVPRGTMDIDTCIQMASWTDYDDLCERIRSAGFHNERPDHPEKFSDRNGQEVDVLPFGGVSIDGKSITWPADASSWTVAGIQEAHDHAWRIHTDGLMLRIAPPAALIYLKMISVHDRPQARRKKDTGDIHFVLRHYPDITGKDRLCSGGSEADIMSLSDGNPTLAAARLAGRDMGRMISDPTAAVLEDLLRIETESATRCPVAHELSGYHDGQFQAARAVLRALRDGLTEVR